MLFAPLPPEVEAEDSATGSDENNRSLPSQQALIQDHRARSFSNKSRSLHFLAGTASLLLLGVLVHWAGLGRNSAVKFGISNTVELLENKTVEGLPPGLPPVLPRYVQAWHCYCGLNHKIGATHLGVGRQECQDLCEAEPRCVAFEINRSGVDCTLRPHCPEPRSSTQGTFLVLFAHRNDGNLYPEDLVHRCGQTDMLRTMPPLGTLPIGTQAPTSTAPTQTVPWWAPVRSSGPLIPAEGGASGDGGPNLLRPWQIGDPSATTQGASTTEPYVSAAPYHLNEGEAQSTSRSVTVEPVKDHPRYLPDWSKQGGGPTGPTTTLLYKKVEEGYSMAGLSPPFSGVRVQYSETCGQALNMLWNQQCELGPAIWRLSRTCRGSSLQDWRDACAHWSSMHSNNNFRDATTEACVNNVDRIDSKDWGGDYLAPATQEEARTCFRCSSVTCVVRATMWDADIIRTGQIPIAKPIKLPPVIGQWAPDGSNNHCKPTENGLVVDIQKRIRKEIHLWTEQEWIKFANAIKLMKSNGRYAAFASKFSKRLYPEQPLFTLLQSMPWNRRFLLDFETELQHFAGDCSVTLPFWSVSLEASPEALQSSVVWAPNRLGGRPSCATGGNGCKQGLAGTTKICAETHQFCLGDGLAAGWEAAGAEGDCQCVHRSPDWEAGLMSEPAIFRFVAEAADLLSLSSRLDAYAASLHCQVTGRQSTLCSQSTAAWDPLFLLMRANLDRLFSRWQRYRATKFSEVTSTCSGCEQIMTLFGQPIVEMLGQSDPKDDRFIQLPKSNPDVSIAYEEHYDADKWLQSDSVVGA